jgi:hypothetical protein
MKKGIFLFVLALVSIMVLASLVSASGDVIRLVTKDSDLNLTEVRLRVIVPNNVLVIEEEASADDCYVLDSFSMPSIDIFEYNSFHRIWALGNRSDSLDIEIFYYLPYHCDVIEGGIYYTREDLNGAEVGDVVSQDPVEDPQQPGDGVADNNVDLDRVFTERDITVAESEEDYLNLLEIAKRDLNRGDNFEFFLIAILLVAGLIVLAVIVIMFLKTPKKFENQ